MAITVTSQLAFRTAIDAGAYQDVVWEETGHEPVLHRDESGFSVTTSVRVTAEGAQETWDGLSKYLYAASAVWGRLSVEGQAANNRSLRGEHSEESRRAYDNSEKAQEYRRAFQQSEAFRQSQRKYQQSEGGQQAQERYSSSDKGKEARKRYQASEKGIEARKRHQQRRREALQIARQIAAERNSKQGG